MWRDDKVNKYFVLQRKSTLSGNRIMKSVLETLQNVFVIKQAPFRIIFKSSAEGGINRVKLVGAFNTAEEANQGWEFIEQTLVPELDAIADVGEIENFVVAKFAALSSSEGLPRTWVRRVMVFT